MARISLLPCIIVSSLALTLSGCSSAVMTRSAYNQIELGTPIESVVQEHGKPYSIKTNNDGSQDYRYIERIPVGDQTVEENNYIFVVKNGQVVSKRYNQELPPAYDEIYDDDPNDVPN